MAGLVLSIGYTAHSRKAMRRIKEESRLHGPTSAWPLRGAGKVW